MRTLVLALPNVHAFIVLSNSFVLSRVHPPTTTTIVIVVEVVKKSILGVGADVIVLSELPPLMTRLDGKVHQTGSTLGFTLGATAHGISSQTVVNSVSC